MSKIEKIRVEATNHIPEKKEVVNDTVSYEYDKVESLFYAIENSDKVNLDLLGQATQLLSLKITNQYKPHDLPQATMSYITHKLYLLKVSHINLNVDFIGTKENSLLESFHIDIVQYSKQKNKEDRLAAPTIEVSTIDNNDEDSTAPIRHSSFLSQLESIGSLTEQIKNKLFPNDSSYQESVIFGAMVLINAEILSAMNAAKSKREIGGLSNAKITNEDEKEKLYNAHFECMLTLDLIPVNENKLNPNKSLKLH